MPSYARADRLSIPREYYFNTLLVPDTWTLRPHSLEDARDALATAGKRMTLMRFRLDEVV
jgi:hypothetical protein